MQTVSQHLEVAKAEMESLMLEASATPASTTTRTLSAHVQTNLLLHLIQILLSTDILTPPAFDLNPSFHANICTPAFDSNISSYTSPPALNLKFHHVIPSSHSSYHLLPPFT